VADHEYNCNGCGKATRRSLLTVKKVLFTGMGAGAKTDRARVTAWLCPDCTKRDSDWMRPPHIQPAERTVLQSSPLARTRDEAI
jgi:hypothetical protein